MENKLRILRFSQSKGIPRNFVLQNQDDELFSLIELIIQPIVFTYRKLNDKKIDKKDIVDAFFWIYREKKWSLEEYIEHWNPILFSINSDEIEEAANRSGNFLTMFKKEKRTYELLQGLIDISSIKVSFRYRDFNMTKFILNVYFENLYEDIEKDIFNYIAINRNIPFVVLNSDRSLYKFYKSPEIYKRIEKEIVDPNSLFFIKNTLQGIIHMGDIANYKINNDAFILYKKNNDHLTIRSNSELNAENVKNLFIDNFFFKNIRRIEGEGFNGTMNLLIDHITEKHIFYDILLRIKILRSSIYVEESEGFINLIEIKRNKAIVFHFEFEDEKIQISVSNHTADATEKTSDDIILGKGQRYVQVNISKAKHFTIINFVKNIILGIIQIYIDNVNQWTKDYSLKQIKILPPQPQIDVRIQKLRKADNKLFPAGYGSTCQGNNQPDFVETEEEARQLIRRGIKVIKFPGVKVNGILITPFNLINKPKYYYSPTEDREVILKSGILVGSGYNYYICCHKDPIIKAVIDENWNITLEEKARKSISEYPTSSKILDVGRRGIVSQKILNILGRNKVFSRYNPIETIDDFSSVFHLLSSVSNNQILRNRYENSNDKIMFINILRKNLGEIINISTLRQEFYDYTEQEIRNYISSSNVVFDTHIGIRVLEIFFDCQIIVFIKKKTEIEFEIPRHQYFYSRRLNNKPLAVLIKHYESSKTKKQKIKFQYEIIAHSTNNPLEIQMINDEQVIDNINLFNIEWSKPNNVYYNVTRQVIDPQGKARKIKVFGNESWIDIEPSQPYNVPEHYQTEQIDTLNNSIMKKVSTIIIELMKILYVLERRQDNILNIDQFFRKNNVLIIEKFFLKYFRVKTNHIYKGPFLSRYIPDLTSPTDLLKYFHNQTGYNSIIKLHKNGYKIIINDKESIVNLKDIMVNFDSFSTIELLKEAVIIKQMNRSEITGKKLYLKYIKRIFIPRTFSNFLNNVSDYIKWSRTSYIVDSLNMFKYISNSRNIFTTTQIKLEHSSISTPFIYTSNGNNYLIQNIFIRNKVLKKMEYVLGEYTSISNNFQEILNIVLQNRDEPETLRRKLQTKSLIADDISNIIKNRNKINNLNELRRVINNISIKESPHTRACKIAYIWQKEKRNIGYNVKIDETEDILKYIENTNTSINTFGYIEGKCNIIEFSKEEIRSSVIIQDGRKRKFRVYIIFGNAAVLKLDNDMLYRG